MFNIFTLFDGPIGDDNESEARVVGVKWWWVVAGGGVLGEFCFYFVDLLNSGPKE
jgi:hypothetical protein